MRDDNGFEHNDCQPSTRDVVGNTESDTDLPAEHGSRCVEQLLKRARAEVGAQSERYHATHLATVRLALGFASCCDDPEDSPDGDSGGGSNSGMLRGLSQPDDDQLSIEQELMLQQVRKGMSLGHDPVAIDRFQILERISAGGMGVVYRAYDPNMDREIALKLYRRRSGLECGGDEARTTGKVNHQNVVTVHEHGRCDGLPYIVMALVRGPTLRHWLGEKRTLPEILDVFVTLADGLQAVHDAGLVHGDFKLENVIIEKSGPKIIDFGMAVTTGEHLVGGTLENMSIELLEHIGHIEDTQDMELREEIERSPLTPRVDQFSFFVALFRALVDFHPFGSQEEFTETLRRSGKLTPDTDVQREFRSHLSETQRRRNIRWPNGELRSIPRSLRKVIARGLDPDPSRRYDDMKAVIVALRRPAIVARRIKWTAAGLLGLVSLTGCVAWFVTPKPCEDSGAVLRDVWSEARAAELPHDGQAALQPAFDAYASSWLETRRDTCEARFKQEVLSPVVFDARNVCLNQRLNEFDQVIDAVASGRLTSEKFGVLNDFLRAPEFCVLAQGSLEVAPDIDISVSDRQADLHRTRLAAELSGDIDTALGSINLALETEYNPLRATASFERGRLLAMHYAGVEQGEKSQAQAAADLTTAIDMASALGDRGLLVLARLYRLRAGSALNWDTVESDSKFLEAIPTNELGESLQAQVFDALAMANYRRFFYTQEERLLDSSIEGFNKAITIYKDRTNVYAEAKAQENLGDAHMLTSDCDHDNRCGPALAAYQQAIDLWTGDARYGAGLPFLGTLFARQINAVADTGGDAKPQCQAALKWLDSTNPPNAGVRRAEIASACTKAYADEPTKVIEFAEQSFAATPPAYAGALLVATEALLTPNKTSSEHLKKVDGFLTKFESVWQKHGTAGEIPPDLAEIASRWRGRLLLREGRYAEAADLLRSAREQYEQAEQEPDELAAIDRDLKTAQTHLAAEQTTTPSN